MLVNALNDRNLIRRYMVVEYKAAARANIGLDENGAFKNHLPVHHLLHSYHWAHLDADHVLVVAYFVHHHVKTIEARADLSVLPSAHSSTVVKDVVKKHAHWEALKAHHRGVDDANMGDLIDSFARSHGHVFAARF